MAPSVSDITRLAASELLELDESSTDSDSDSANEEEDRLAAIICELDSIVIDAAEQSLGFLRSFVPEFKISYSTSALNAPQRMQEHLEHQNPHNMQQLYGMSSDAFRFLVDELGLTDSKSVTAEEQLSTFLLLVRQSQSLRGIQEQTQRALGTQAYSCRLVMDRLTDRNGFYGKYVQMPTARTRPHASLVEHERFKEFQGCIGAIDGTHLPIIPTVKGADHRLEINWAEFRDGKKKLSFNALVACDFDMLLIYVASPFEGSSNDAGCWNEVYPTDLRVPPGQYFLEDAGFALGEHCLVPYRSVRYHLQEYKTYWRANSSNDIVSDHLELYNLRHASRRMIIERAFGVLKSRYPTLDKPLPESITVQGLPLPALCALHNVFRRFNDPAVEAKLAYDAGVELSRRAMRKLSREYPAARKDPQGNAPRRSSGRR